MSKDIRRKQAATAVPLFLGLALMLSLAGPALPQEELKAVGFTKSLTIEIRNPGPVDLMDYPVVLKVADIRAKAPDFNSYNFGLFEVVNGEYRLLQTQADDLDKDRYHDEIFFLRTLPARSTTKLFCYYSPKGGMQLMITSKVAVRPGVKEHAGDIFWEAMPAAWKFDAGRIIPYGKFTKAMVLPQMRSDDGRPQGWGMRLLDPDETGGAGGLSVWDGGTRRALYSNVPAADIHETPVVLSKGPLRTLIRVDFMPVQYGPGSVTLSCLYSQQADSSWVRVDVSVREKTGGPVIAGPTLRKPADAISGLDKTNGYFSVWGRGTSGSGESGTAVIFRPSDLAGVEDMKKETGLKLNLVPGKGLTYWLASAWGRGVNSPAAPASKNWAVAVASLAGYLSQPVEISFQAGK